MRKQYYNAASCYCFRHLVKNLKTKKTKSIHSKLNKTHTKQPKYKETKQIHALQIITLRDKNKY